MLHQNDWLMNTLGVTHRTCSICLPILDDPELLGDGLMKRTGPVRAHPRREKEPMVPRKGYIQV
jgi:hypothetical protein